MKHFSVIISVIIFSSCFSHKYEPIYQATLANKVVARDTIYLDTLVIDNKTEIFISRIWVVKPITDEVLFLQTIKNKTNDTLEVQARASAGWVAPAYERIVNPNSHSKISYQMLTINREGQITTTIDIEYKRTDTHDKLSKHIIVRLCGRKE